MPTVHLSIVDRATFGLSLSQLFKLLHRWLQILPLHRNDMKRMISDKAELVAEFKPVTFPRTLQNPAQVNLGLGGV